MSATERGRAVRVLQVFGCMEPGGAETRTIEILDRLARDQFHVDVCALSGRAGSLDGRVRAHGGDVYPLRLDVHFPLRFLRLLRQHQYDVVHSHVHYASGAILALAARAGVAIRVAHFRSTHVGRPLTPRVRAQSALMRWLIQRYATAIVGCGEGTMEAAWSPGWRRDPRCRVIYNTVDAARFQAPVDVDSVRDQIGVPRTSMMFLHVGNATEAKNHGRLLTIFSRISAMRNDARLVLAGAGTEDPGGPVARAVADLKLGSRVAVLGVRTDVPRLIAAADVLLLPSLYEGLPGAVLEACAAGVPALASDVPGVREIADRLPLVRYLPLSAGDDVWARAACGLAVAMRRDARRTASADFRRSVFHVDCAVDAHRALWTARGGASARPAAVSPVTCP